ncbi:MAG: ATP-binding cassette domain-containing protein [Propionibacteriales bacterium]|nr:ATP-binding cassette domain-containing protein [Propionibacteriales bacterium]
MTVTIRRLRHTYAGATAPAVDIAELRLSDGVTGLVGVNGAGKSTLLRILARILPQDAGVVELDGTNVALLPRRELAVRIGFMPQEFALPYGARVLDSLRYLAWLKGLVDPTATERSRELLGLLGLAERGGDKVAALSGGMVRRLALAQALLTRPDVLLLDEPTTGLDPEQRVVVRELLADDRFGARIAVVSSHVMEDVESLADRVVLLDGGEVGFAGPLTDFCRADDGTVQDAETAFVRRLVGART